MEDERGLELHPVLGDLAVRVDCALLALDPRFLDVFERLRGTGYPRLDCIIKALGRRGIDLGSACDRPHRLLSRERPTYDQQPVSGKMHELR